jgi:hypothetical protein
LEEQTVERIDPFELFGPEIRENVQGLSYLGYLTRQIEFCGHTYQIETLRPYVKFAIGQAMEPYRNTLVEPNVFAAMHLGMALTSVDGKESFCPPEGDNLIEFVKGRFNWVTGKSGWWQPTIDYLFAEWVKLEQEAGAAIQELHSLSQRGRDTLQPSPDSSIEPASSSEETAGDTQRLDPSS